MDHPIRYRLVAEIRRKPGLRLHELAALVGLTSSSLKWHMQMLVRTKLVLSHSAGQARFYTAPGLLPEALRLASAMSELRRYRRGRTLALLVRRPSLTAKEAAAALGVSTGAARNALDFLVAQGLADRQLQGARAPYEATGLGRSAAAAM